MKLNKAICKRCINKTDIIWYGDDETNWDSNYVICPYNRKQFITEDISDKCPYTLEHIMKEQ